MKKFLFIFLALIASGCSKSSTYPEDAIIKTYYWEDITEDDLEYMRLEEGVYEVSLNEDGSIKYVVSGDYLEEARQIFKSEIEYLINDPESYGITFVNLLKMNEDLTNFEVYLNSDSIGLDEAFLLEDLLMYGYIYYEYFGESEEIPEISVTVYNLNNEVIENLNYSNFYNNLESLLTDEELAIFHSYHIHEH